MTDRAMLGVDRVDLFHRFPVRLGSPEVVNNVDLPHYQNAVLIDDFTGRSRGLSTSLRRGSAAVISVGTDDRKGPSLAPRYSIWLCELIPCWHLGHRALKTIENRRFSR